MTNTNTPRAVLTELDGTDFAALDITGTSHGIVRVTRDGDDIDIEESGRGGGTEHDRQRYRGVWYDLDALLAEAGVQRMVDGDYAQSWREVEPGLWTVELTELR